MDLFLVIFLKNSGNEQEVSDYLVSFAKERGLFVIQDEYKNVIIKKPATKGYDNLPAVILQGHMDMVCEKNNDTVFDFMKDPLKLKIEGDYISAEGTTLGADNGIAVAYTLAILASDDIMHPDLEVVITTDEEAGMTGANNLDTSILKGKYLINMDAEEEGTLIVGCAGGAKVKIQLPIKKETKKGQMIILSIKGLKGGHSGEDINKNRGNANKLMGRVLYGLKEEIPFRIIEMNGGSKDNAIPREADVKIIIDDKDLDKFTSLITKWGHILKDEYSSSDVGLDLSYTIEGDSDIKCFTANTTDSFISLLNIIPNGICSMSGDIKGLVESSLNLGVIVTEEDCIACILALRSSVKSRLDNILDRLKITTDLLDAKLITRSQYPGWQYSKNSNLRKLFAKTYENIHKKEPNIKAIHAGLECGIFADKIKDIDIIALGPNMEDVHTPDERLSISSAARVYELIIQVLKDMKN